MIAVNRHSNMYTLQRYTGPSSRHICPSCGRKRCFVYYVNENGKALNKIVGRCDHQNKCGYHYTPKDFFRDHPSLKIPESWMQPMPEVERKLWTINPSEVRRFRSNESTLGKYLHQLRGDIFLAAADIYQLGATINGSTIFWQIDIDGKVRTGKVMAYGEDGHRIKTEEYDRINWMHRLLMKDNLLPKEFEVTQCLFGEHLLRRHPEKPVAIVESEKTAVIMATINPDMIWLATGGKFNLRGDKLTPLKGRKIWLYPDADAIQYWKDFAASVAQHYDIAVCDLHYTDDDISNKRDIADLIIQKLQHYETTSKTPTD